MPATQLKAFLDSHSVKYVTLTHSQAFTAMEIAESAHVPGREMAKTVVVKMDGKLAMAVLPAPRKLDVARLRQATEAVSLELAHEYEFRGDFPGCEIGAMPPFGNLYGMEVFVDAKLAEDDKIAFNAGSHTELVQMAYADFQRLVKPTVVAL